MLTTVVQELMKNGDPQDLIMIGKIATVLMDRYRYGSDFIMRKLLMTLHLKLGPVAMAYGHCLALSRLSENAPIC